MLISQSHRLFILHSHCPNTTNTVLHYKQHYYVTHLTCSPKDFSESASVEIADTLNLSILLSKSSMPHAILPVQLEWKDSSFGMVSSITSISSLTNYNYVCMHKYIQDTNNVVLNLVRLYCMLNIDNLGLIPNN